MPRKASRVLLTTCVFLSIVCFKSLLDRFIDRRSNPNIIEVGKSNNAKVVDKKLRLANRELSARGFNLSSRIRSEISSTYRYSDTPEQEELKTSFNSNPRADSLAKASVQQGFNVFKHHWCRMQRARLEWESLLGACLTSTKWEEPKDVRLGINQFSDPSKSFISHWDIGNAGEFSRFLIQTVSTSNTEKNIGGDSWRIHISGPSSLAPSVLDHGNGSYEVLFLIMEHGDYEAKIFLDYTLCNGFKDPPFYWFKKGNSQGKNQPDGVLKGDRPYLIAPFRNGEKITFNVPSSENNMRNIDALTKEVSSKSTRLQQYTCDASCGTLLWDGLGRWVNGQWKPYIKDRTQKDTRNKEGVFFTFGDSISNAFYGSLVAGPYKELCNTAFIACRAVYHWVYDMKGYWGDGVTSPREPLPDEMDYDHELVMRDLKKTLFNPDMTEKSVLLLNIGIHFAAAVNFTDYKRVIDQLINLVIGKTNHPNADGTFKGRFIWKSTSAIHRERFPNPHKDVRRFLTFSRVKLYNAYATSAMCRAGIDVIDVHPISESYPLGTASASDPVHYANVVFRDVEALLSRLFSP
ncbi:uncharacterized protein [Montipora foliosa]|uniref:uncharacterized protein n=1 Tax=Montipora foliosa TaxID=591990 RepID=UPI0035F185C8